MPDYLVYEVAQGSEEWLQARAGVVTASMASTIRAKVGMLSEQQQKYVDAILSGVDEKEALSIAGYKAKPSAEGVKRALAGEKVGDWSDVTKKYAFRLAVERIAGRPLDEGYQTWAMRRGNELEPFARMAHEEISGLIVKEAGFITTADGKYGASADGFSNDGAGCEYKCFIDPERIHDFWIDFDASVVLDQIMFGMWVTGLKSWHLGMYCPALEPVGKELWLKTFHRDDDYIEKLEADMVDFERLVSSYEEKLRA